MNYELAKELKTSGFPQKFDIGRPMYSEKDAIFENVNLLSDPSDKICIPTLSELIEACGGRFRVLERRIENLPPEIPFIYQAHGFKDPNKIEVDNYTTSAGISPEEAVAKLWLALKNPYARH